MGDETNLFLSGESLEKSPFMLINAKEYSDKKCLNNQKLKHTLKSLN